MAQKELKHNIMEVMASVVSVKRMAENAGLIAEFIPVIGAIEIMDTNRHQVGISFDGKRIKPSNTNKYYRLDRYLKSWEFANSCLNKIHFPCGKTA